MQDSVFTKIIKGELPSHKVYEDDQTIAIIPLYSRGKGTVLVIPKKQVDYFTHLEPATYTSLMAAVQKVAQRMEAVLGAARVGIQIVGLDVPHVHVHVIAFDTIEEFHHEADESTPPDFAANAALAQRLSMLQ